jgi:hypothetical protein
MSSIPAPTFCPMPRRCLDLLSIGFYRRNVGARVIEKSNTRQGGDCAEGIFLLRNGRRRGQILDDFAAASGLRLLIPGPEIPLSPFRRLRGLASRGTTLRHNEVIGSCQKWSETPPAPELEIAVAVSDGRHGIAFMHFR